MSGLRSVAGGGSQTGRVADELIDRILSGHYEIGDRLPPERQLAVEFGVSRPVIREALRMLALLQVVESQVGRGAFVIGKPDLSAVSGLTAPRDLFDVIDVREIVETGALRLAQSRATPADRKAVSDALADLRAAVLRGEETAELDVRFHRAIIDASGSKLLADIWGRLENEIRRSIRVSPFGRSMSAEILTDHESVAAGVIEGSLPEALKANTRLHLSHREFLTELDHDLPPEAGS